MTTLRHRVRRATAPTPEWSLTDPATLAAIAAIVSAILGDFLHVGHPDHWVQLGLLILTGMVVPAVAFAKHHLAFGAFLGDLASALAAVAKEQARTNELVAQARPFEEQLREALSKDVPVLLRAPEPDLTPKLGKGPKKDDPRNLKLASYVRPSLRAPAAADWSTKVLGWPMMANDRIGDCTCAAAGHLIQLWTAWANPPAYVPPDAAIVEAYSAVAGYQANNPATDRGAVELDVLNYWRTSGIAGHKIDAFVELNVSRLVETRYAIATFGAAYIGLALPRSAQRQAVWDVAPGVDGTAGSWGGHAVPVVAYDKEGLVCVTWGRLQRMTWRFFRAYCDEAYAVLSHDFLTAAGVNPHGLNVDALNGDLAKLGK